MAEFIGPDGGYYIDGDDLDHIKTVIRWTDADGKAHIKEYIAPFSTFALWHGRSAKIIEEVHRRRAEAHILTLPKGRLRKARG